MNVLTKENISKMGVPDARPSLDEPGTIVIRFSQVLRCVAWRWKGHKYSALSKALDSMDPLVIKAEPADMDRWNLVCCRLLACDIPTFTFHYILLERPGSMSPTERCQNHHPILMDDIRDSKSISIGFTLAGLLYGGLHALAWNAHFASHAEQLLWRVAVCIVAGTFPAIWILELLGDRFPVSYWRITKVLVLLIYVLGRAYLVVECFINLGHVPAGVYTTPSWTAYLPHIT